MPACSIKPQDRKVQIQKVGRDLIANYGKKRHYTVLEVKNANRRQGVKYDVACWSHAFFNSHSDFDEYHARIGETCDYAAMKSEMAASIAPDGGSLPEGIDFNLSWLELPSIDLGGIFDSIDL